MYVVIGTAPSMDTSITVGPFRTVERATEVATDGLTPLGWVTEVCELLRIEEVPLVSTWEG